MIALINLIMYAKIKPSHRVQVQALPSPVCCVRYLLSRWRCLVYFTLLGSLSLDASAAGLPVFDVVNYLQNISAYARQAEQLVNQTRQIEHQIDMLKQQKLSLKSLTALDWRQLDTLLADLDQLSQRGQALSLASADLEAQFQTHFQAPSVLTPDDTYAIHLRDARTTTLDTLRGSLAVLHHITTRYQEEQAHLNTLKAMSLGAEGHLQALQINASLSAETINQLQVLKRLIATQTETQAVYQAHQITERALNQALTDQLVRAVPTNFPRFQSPSNFGLIPHFGE